MEADFLKNRATEYSHSYLCCNGRQQSIMVDRCDSGHAPDIQVPVDVIFREDADC